MNRIHLKSRKPVFENTRFRVFSDHVAGAGMEVENYLVVAPHTRRADLVSGVTVLPVWQDRLVLLRNYRHAAACESLEGVRGFVDLNEDPVDAALRELEEETGLICAREKLVPLGFCLPEASTLASRLALFAAMECMPGAGNREAEPGLGELLLVTVEEARRMLPTIEDVSTALALYRYLA